MNTQKQEIGSTNIGALQQLAEEMLVIERDEASKNPEISEGIRVCREKILDRIQEILERSGEKVKIFSGIDKDAPHGAVVIFVNENQLEGLGTEEKIALYDKLGRERAGEQRETRME